jgi:hypothetical protein
MLVIFNLYALVGIGAVALTALGAEAVGLPGHVGWFAGVVADLALRPINQPPRRRKKSKRRSTTPNTWFSGQTGGQLFWIIPVWLLSLFFFIVSMFLLAI